MAAAVTEGALVTAYPEKVREIEERYFSARRAGYSALAIIGSDMRTGMNQQLDLFGDDDHAERTTDKHRKT